MAVRASRLVLPSQMHFTLVIIVTMMAMLGKILVSRAKKYLSAAFARSPDVVEVAQEPVAASSSFADHPTRAMRRPRIIAQNLTSEFIHEEKIEE